MGVVPWPMGPNPHAQNWPLGYRGPPRLDPPQQHRNSGNTRCSRPNKILVMSNFAAPRVPHGHRDWFIGIGDMVKCVFNHGTKTEFGDHFKKID